MGRCHVHTRKLAKTRQVDRHSRQNLVPRTARHGWARDNDEQAASEKIHRDEALVVVASSETSRLESLLVLKKSVAAVECK
jgi:hypothetical protein